MSLVRDISVGFAAAISGAALATYSPSGAYTSTQTGIVFKKMPATPNRVIVISVVPTVDSPNLPMGSVMVQCRYRGAPNNPLDVEDLGDSVFDLLQGTSNVTYGSYHVVQIIRQVSTPMGIDDKFRAERVDQFYLDLDTPATANRPATGN